MLKLSFQLFDNSPIWNCPLVCLVFRDSQLSAGFFTEPLVACKSRASTDYRASPWENRQRRKYACLQRNLSFFAVHVSLPCLVHPALLEKPKRPQIAWRFCGTRKATRSPERLCCTLVEYEIERLYYFQIHLRILAHFHLEIVLLLDDGVLLLSSNGGHPCWERAGSDHRFDLNTVVAFV